MGIARPCRTTPPTEAPAARPGYGTIVHLAYRNGPNPTPEERCGTACMVIGPEVHGARLQVLRLWSFMENGPISTLTFLVLGHNHHIAEDQ